MDYNHDKFMQDVKEGLQFIENADEWKEFAECEITKGIYNKIPLGNGQTRHEHIGDITTIYNFAVNYANDKISINGKVYAVSEDWEYTIKILKTKIRATGGAKGLMKFLAQPDWGRMWIEKVIENVRPISIK